jgi:CheY-like chemotaxis protein
MTRPTILLVDDDEVFVDALKAVLAREYDVVAAYSGEQAVAMITERLPDLIVLDVMMSYLAEGYDLAAMLKKNPRTARVPILILTGVERTFEIRSRLERTWVDVEGFMTKPPDLAKLRETIASLLAAKATPDGRS